MKQEIYNGKWTVESTDGKSCDLVVLPKFLAENVTMTARGFDELFFHFLEPTTTHVDAYEKAEHVHEQYFNTRKYSSYESFKAVQYRGHKK